MRKTVKRLLCTISMLALFFSVFTAGFASADTVPAESESTNLVGNPGFEADSLSPWAGAGTYEVVNNNAQSGTNSAQVEGTEGNSGVSQTISGLSPNTAYTLTGWFKVDAGNVSIGVKDYGGDQIAYSTSGTSYSKQTITFTTGASNTSVLIFLWKGDAGYGYGDDFSLTAVPTSTNPEEPTNPNPGTTVKVNFAKNPGFESGRLSPWAGTGKYVVVKNNAHSGSYSARVGGTKGQSSIKQTISGLNPNTTYTLTSWLKAASGSISVGVKNYGGKPIAYSTSSTSYKNQTITFTTGASNTSVQIYMWKGNAGYGYGDDFSLTTVDPIGIEGNWNLVYSDEFNGTSLDSSTWNSNWFGAPDEVTQAVNPNYELAAYDPANVSVGNGSLSLAATSNPVTVNGKTYPYRSGIITTNGHKQFTYGAFEARIYSPASSPGVIANWPSFWTDGQNWPTDGEMDIMEGLDGQAAYHFVSAAGNPGSSVPGDFTGWHTYAADWEPGIIKYYYDGVLVGTITSGITSSPMYIIFAYAIGTPYGGPTTIPNTMKVDYVRVWQH